MKGGSTRRSAAAREQYYELRLQGVDKWGACNQMNISPSTMLRYERWFQLEHPEAATKAARRVLIEGVWMDWQETD